MPKTCMTDGSPVTEDHREINPVTGQQKGYVVLCPDERKKGFVRPLRRVYVHTGRKPQYPLRDLTDEEKSQYEDYGYEKYEEYPETERPALGRFWTADDLRSGCGAETRIAESIAETYARDPSFYGGTFCVRCREHLPLAEFVWKDDGTVVGS